GDRHPGDLRRAAAAAAGDGLELADGVRCAQRGRGGLRTVVAAGHTGRHHGPDRRLRDRRGYRVDRRCLQAARVSASVGTSLEVDMGTMIPCIEEESTIKRVMLLGSIGLAGCAATAVLPLHAQGPPARLTTFLQQRIGVDQTQLAAIERGDAVVKVLETDIKRDVAVFGIITVDVPRAFYVTRLQDFPNSLRARTRPHFGIFSTPASPADVADATVPPHDVDDVKKCKPGDCRIKMPAAEMQRLQSEIDWSAADPGTQLNAYA